MPFLPPSQQRQSTEDKFLITPTLLTTGKRYRPLKKIAISNLCYQKFACPGPPHAYILPWVAAKRRAMLAV